jgi:CheY-like chemotaxis protein
VKSILVIEGDAMVRRFLRAALEASHYSVVEAANDVDGLTLAARISAQSFSTAWASRLPASGHSKSCAAVLVRTAFR